MNLARSERAALADLFVTLGPDQPTLCEGWDTKDLLIHLLVRENSPLGAAGIRLPALRTFTEQASAHYAKQPWSALVEKYRSGPPGWNPTGWGKLDELTNGGEMFIHHEDARRGQLGWEPRTFDAETTAELEKSLRMSKLALRNSPVGVTAELPGSGTVELKAGEPTVTLAAEPGEILVWLSGRDACRIEFAGDDGSVATLRTTKRGL